jgi:phage terminase Nu1 subunit (DNA packaging protein)
MTGTPIAEASREVGVSRSTVREWATAGLFHRHRDGSVSKRGLEELQRLAEERAAEQEEEEESGDLRHQLLQAQVRERKAIGKLRELELAHESGRYVELALVQRDGADTAERVISILRAIPQRTALALECECQRAAVVEKRIGEEIERAIAEMKDSTYIKPRSKK